MDGYNSIMGFHGDILGYMLNNIMGFYEKRGLHEKSIDINIRATSRCLLELDQAGAGWASWIEPANPCKSNSWPLRIYPIKHNTGANHVESALTLLQLVLNRLDPAGTTLPWPALR